jgi:endogenous inhibitor of DNA gyrase (YacG/DUF329 family)
MQWLTYPYYRFCSKRCQDIGVLRAYQGEEGMIGRTERELRAIKDARKNLAQTLTELGLMEPFFNRSPDDIDCIIQACIDGFQRSMVEQMAGSKDFDDEIPF